ncbi:fungal-specific transcription factor [Apiospora saccharicola]|uniref:Fungal-specific transcription factor n=1 Tax=Apiospora saccharicola TaxID=335842 RepID=A0ABR1UJX8_9PEZI
MPDLHDRLVHLERLVMSQKTGPPSVPTPPDVVSNSVGNSGSTHNTPDGGRSECGSMHISATELSYVGSDHWAAIADSIADLRDYVDRGEHLKSVESPDQISREGDSCGKTVGRSSRALLLYGCQPGSRAEILAAMPPKPVVDRYYEAFWANPTETPVIWLGLLFGMICLAVITSGVSEISYGSDTDNTILPVNIYREKTAQCLVAGEYTKCGPYVLETMIHYVYIEFLLSPDADHDLWFLLALEVNTAMRMGYHREPSNFPALTPSNAKCAAACGMGMPRMVAESQCDTGEPRNLNDADLEAGTTELPTSRPETEYTTSTGVIARRRLLVVLGKISDLIGGVKACTYDEVMRVDQALHQAAATIPQPLQMKPITVSITESPQVIMSRVFLGHLFYKGQLLLHQRFLHLKSSSLNEDTFAYSRKACLEASLGSLQLQKDLDEETRPGGQLDTLRWRVTSIMNHQFLTATMTLCSLLHRGNTFERRDVIISALRGARDIWTRTIATSKEAQRATDTIGFVLAKVGEARETPVLSLHRTLLSARSSRDNFNDVVSAQDTTLNTDTGFSAGTTGNMLPPFWGTFPTSTLQENLDIDMGMDFVGPGAQALHTWMEMNWPTGDT